MRGIIEAGSLIMAIYFIGMGVTAYGMDVTRHQVGNLQVEIISVYDMELGSNLLFGMQEQEAKFLFPSGTFSVPVNVFLIRRGSDLILIDAGIGNSVVPALEQLGVAPSDITSILLTHMHIDHIEGLLDGEEAVFRNAAIYLSFLEHEYWNNPDNILSYAPEQREMMSDAFELCRRIFNKYDDRIHLFTPNQLSNNKDALFPSIFPMATYGHTPGHSSFMINNNGDSLFITGDELLSEAIQFLRPNVATAFDIDQESASQTRERVFKYLAESQTPFTGGHLSHPSLGMLHRYEDKNSSFWFARQK